MSLRRHFGTLFKDTLLYGLSSAVNKSVWIILVPILARVFSPAEYAVIDVCIVSCTVASTFLFLGLDSSLVRFYYMVETGQERRAAVSTVLKFEAAVLVLSCIVLYFFSSDISLIIFKTRGHARIIRTVVLIVPAIIMNGFFLNLLRCRFERAKFLLVSAGTTAAQVLLTLYLVLYRGRGTEGIFDAMFCAQAAFAALGYLMTRRDCSSGFSFPLLKEMLGFGASSLARSFSQTAIFFADRFFLVALMPLGTVGLYSMGARLASVMNMVVMGFVLAWSPFALSIQGQAGARRTYSRALTYYMAACSTMVAALALFSHEALNIIAPSYRGAEVVVGILALSYMLTGAYSIVSIGATITGQAVHLAWPSCVGAALNIAGYLALIPALGSAGAAWSSLAANLASLVLLILVSRKVYPVKYELGRLLGLGGACLAVVLAGAFVDRLSRAHEVLLLKALLFSGYIVVLAAAGVFGRKEITGIAGMFRSQGADTASGG